VLVLARLLTLLLQQRRMGASSELGMTQWHQQQEQQLEVQDKHLSSRQTAQLAVQQGRWHCRTGCAGLCV
jgi:hypothetical protein